MKPSTRKHRRPEQWQALIQQWQQSSLSALAFCKQNKLGYASFCQWRKRLCQHESFESDSSGFIDLGTLTPSTPSTTSCPQRVSLKLSLGGWLNLSIQL